MSLYTLSNKIHLLIHPRSQDQIQKAGILLSSVWHSQTIIPPLPLSKSSRLSQVTDLPAKQIHERIMLGILRSGGAILWKKPCLLNPKERGTKVVHWIVLSFLDLSTHNKLILPHVLWLWLFSRWFFHFWDQAHLCFLWPSLTAKFWPVYLVVLHDWPVSWTYGKVAQIFLHLAFIWMFPPLAAWSQLEAVHLPWLPTKGVCSCELCLLWFWNFLFILEPYFGEFLEDFEGAQWLPKIGIQEMSARTVRDE